MHVRDDIARRNLELTEQAVRKGEYGKPWLDLDVEAYRAYREGKTSHLPAPLCDDPVDAMMMAGVQGKNVLCLAGGGGQQSAAFSLLGARVTVLDLTPDQLEHDKCAAQHYGYKVRTVRGDMRDLSAFPSSHFDRVYQPISILYVPDLREVYHGVARILKPSGLCSADYPVPLLYMAKNRGWDGKGYTLHVTQPYRRGPILETKDGVMNFAEGESYGEFHHLLSDILNGLIAEGFSIRAVWENPRPDSRPPLADLKPGIEPHVERYLPFGLSVVSERAG